MMQHDAFITADKGVSVPFPAYVDTACAKAVGSDQEAKSLMKYCKEHQWPYAQQKEKEPFRFGPGSRIWSSYALILPVVWAGTTVVLRISIIDKNVPFLLSKHVFKRLGASIDLEDNVVSFKRFPGKKQELHDLRSGHVAIALVDPEAKPPIVTEEVLALCASGQEVTLADPILRATLKEESLPVHGVHKVKWDLEIQEESEDDNASTDEGYNDRIVSDLDSDMDPYFDTLHTCVNVHDNNRTRAAPF